MTGPDSIRPSFADGDVPAPDATSPVGDEQRVSDPDDETTRADVRIDEDATDPLDEQPVGDPDLEAPAQEDED